MDKVVAIVQARLGSKRLPNKMFMELGGFKIIEWVVTRLRKSKLIDDIIIATSCEKKDEELAEFAINNQLLFFRGSEKDVLGRFVEASKICDSKIIIRVCADNPFIDPQEVDRLVRFYKQGTFDYAFNHQDRMGTNYADGFGAEVFSINTLHYLSLITKRNYHREHLTSFIWDNVEKFDLGALPAPASLSYPKLRFDLDIQEDYLFLKSLVKRGINLESNAVEIVNIARKMLKEF